MCFENLSEEVNYLFVPLLLSHLFFITHLQKKLELETSWASPSLRAFNQLLKMNNLSPFAILFCAPNSGLIILFTFPHGTHSVHFVATPSDHKKVNRLLLPCWQPLETGNN